MLLASGAAYSTEVLAAAAGVSRVHFRLAAVGPHEKERREVARIGREVWSMRESRAAVDVVSVLMW